MSDVRRRTKPGEALAYFQANLHVVADDCKLWPYANTRGGYGVLVIQQRRHAVHVLACTAFHGPKPFPRAEALHGECNTPSCWNGAHLHWGAHQENMRDQARDGTKARGERGPRAKLNPTEVAEIRRRWATGERLAAIAADFGISRATVSDLGLRKRWQHLN